MPEIRVAKRFQREYSELPKNIQRKVDKAIRLLAGNMRYPSLHTKPVQGAPGVYEARVDDQYRMTYERLPGDILQLRVVGLHDKVLKEP
jgi:mRNA-degrading endonuclease RelE of RelBE toxin-antitoxin system